MYKVVLIEDTKDTADSLRDQIQRSGKFELIVDPVGDATNGLATVLQHRPDIVAIDMHLLDRSPGNIDKKHGMKLMKDIREHRADVAMLAMTQWPDPIFPLIAKHSKANGFYQKDRHRGQFCEALGVLAAGDTWFRDDGALNQFIAKRNALEAALRPRQHEVFRLAVHHYVAKGRRRGVAKWIQTELTTPGVEETGTWMCPAAAGGERVATLRQAQGERVIAPFDASLEGRGMDARSLGRNAISEYQVERHLRDIRKALGTVMRSFPPDPSIPRIRQIFDHIQMIDDVVLPFGYDLVPPVKRPEHAS